MQELKAVPEIIKNVNVSADKIRYWISLLGAKTIRKGRVSFIPLEIAAQIEMMANLVAKGKSPKDAAKKVVTMQLPNEAIITVPTSSDKNFASLEAAILAMATQIKELSGQVRELRKENRVLHFRLTPPVAPQKTVTWQPAPIKKSSYPWYKTLWFELISPERLRSN